MTYEPVCVDCDGILTFSGIVWRHVDPGVNHAPMPRRSGRPKSAEQDDDWTIPVAPESESELRAAWGDR